MFIEHPDGKIEYPSMDRIGDDDENVDEDSSFKNALGHRQSAVGPSVATGNFPG